MRSLRTQLSSREHHNQHGTLGKSVWDMHVVWRCCLWVFCSVGYGVSSVCGSVEAGRGWVEKKIAATSGVEM